MAEPGKMANFWLIAAMAAVVLVLVAVVIVIVSTGSSGSSAAAASASSGGSLANAYDACVAQDKGNTLQLQDNGSTIVVDTRNSAGSVAGVTCVFVNLSTPASITAEVGSTTALMGEQSAEHDGIRYSWSYHPSNGLNMVITQEK